MPSLRLRSTADGDFPSEVQVVVRWGTSVLSVERFSPPRPVVFANGRAGLLVTAQGLELVAGDRRQPIRSGDEVRARVGELEILVDATESDFIAEAVPAPRTYTAAASDASSLALHVAALAVVFFLHVPRDPSEIDLAALSLDTPATTGVKASAAEIALDGDMAAGAPGPGEGTAASDPRTSAAGSGASIVASAGRPHEPQDGKRALAAETSRGAALEEAYTFGLISLIGAENAPALGVDAWSSVGSSDGPSWGADGGEAQGFGGLSLTGIGEGTGGRGSGVAMGAFGLGRVGTGPGGGCDDGCGGAGLGRTNLRGHGGGRGVRVHVSPTSICGVPIDGTEGINACAGSALGRLPPETIQRVVRQSFGRFRICYEQSLRMQPNLHDRVTVSFVIGRDGSVASASATSDQGAALSSCVATAFYGLSFPEPAGGIVRVTYPITFTPGE